MTSSDRPVLDVHGLVVEYPGRRRSGPLRAVNDVSLAVWPRSTLGLIGESGSGKSTLAAAVLGLRRPTSGSIVFEGEEITRAKGADRRRIARRLQVVFQDPYSSLDPMRTIGDTIAEPLRYNLRLDQSRSAARVAEVLDLVSLPAATSSRYSSELSSGQRQRVAIARALAVSPRLIICDEPVSALDLSVQAQILNLLNDLKERLQMSYLFISHDMAVIRHMADHVAVMKDGRMVESGPTALICDHSEHPYTRALLAAVPTLAAAP